MEGIRRLAEVVIAVQQVRALRGGIGYQTLVLRDGRRIDKTERRRTLDEQIFGSLGQLPAILRCTTVCSVDMQIWPNHSLINQYEERWSKAMCTRIMSRQRSSPFSRC